MKFTFKVKIALQYRVSFRTTGMGFYLIKWGFINIELINCYANDDVGKVGHFAYLQSIYGHHVII